MSRRYFPGVPGRVSVLLSALFLAGCMGSDGARAQAPGEIEALLQAGEYADAIDGLERMARTTPSTETVTLLAETLSLVGRYEDAESILVDALDASPDAHHLRLLLGRVLLETGRRDEATTVFEQVEESASGADRLFARLHRGEILLESGQQEEALEEFDSFIDVYNGSSDLDSDELLAVAGAVRNLEVTNSALLQDALRAYDESLARDPENIAAHRQVGMLFVRTYQVRDARAALGEVLSRRSADPEALLGLALAARLEGSSEAAGFVDRALEANPRLVPALVVRAQIRLAGEDLAGAEEDLETALEVDPTSSEALAVLAGARFLQDRHEESDELIERAMELNPRDALFFVTLSDLVSTRRFYEEAAEFADRGIAVDSIAWIAYGAKGLNQLRTGEIAEGRENLEIAFEGDPYNLWYKNTLDLLDVMDGFETYESDRITLLVDPEDGGALARYMLDVANDSYESLAARYDYRPDPPIRIEAFRRSADFSVRTVGLAGLGALGVAFGDVVAMDSPSARGPGGYHWASTLWHEMAHVMHLGLTDHRVPRWLSEGLAVHEERIAGEGWGSRPSLSFFAAYLDERLRPPSELSQSFVRPRFPEEVGFAYVLGSLISDWIETEWGFPTIRGMLEAYGEGLSHERVLEQELGLDLEELDDRFDRWIREEYSGAFAAAEAAIEVREVDPESRSDIDWLTERAAQAPNDVAARTALGRLLIEEGRPDEAEPWLVEARDLFPRNPDPLGPNRLLASIYEERGDAAAEQASLEAYLANHADDYEAHMRLGELREAAGDLAGAAEAIQNALLVYPFEIPVHARLAQMFEDLGGGPGEVRERQVILDLAPVDRAGAYYDLARAQLRAGQPEAARASVLSALELAPRFPEAQDLLLEIMR